MSHFFLFVSIYRPSYLYCLPSLLDEPAMACRMAKETAMPIELPDLPYPANALEPYISKATLELHHGKHHRAYMNNVIDITSGTPFAARDLEDIVSISADHKERRWLFNNAAQAWNHAFYWQSLRPDGGGVPHGAIAHSIDESFGSFDDFAELFRTVALGQFGSGWLWLVRDGTRLGITCTDNAATPLTTAQTPLLTLDLWEHAYYLDFQNRRDVYVDAFLNHLVNWDFANQNLVSDEYSSPDQPWPKVAVS